MGRDYSYISYWDSVARMQQEARPKTLWRSYNDIVNYTLFERWLPKEKAKLLLKTDIFDESLGDGLCPLLASRAVNIVGIDVSVLTAQAARSRHPLLRVKVANVCHLSFSDNTFDVVISNSTLDHFESEDEIVAGLRESHRVLRVGGHLLITLDNLANPVITLRNLLPFRFLKFLNIVPYYIGATFTPRRLKHNLAQTGLEALELASIMQLPRICTMATTRLLERYAGQEVRRRFLGILMNFEYLSSWPTRFLTGYYVPGRTIKR